MGSTNPRLIPGRAKRFFSSSELPGCLCDPPNLLFKFYRKLFPML